MYELKQFWGKIVCLLGILFVVMAIYEFGNIQQQKSAMDMLERSNRSISETFGPNPFSEAFGDKEANDKLIRQAEDASSTSS